MSAAADAVAQGLEGASRTGRFDGIRAKCRDDSIAELLQRAPEDLAACLEFGPEAQETEPVVARYVQTGDELVQKYIELEA